MKSSPLFALAEYFINLIYSIYISFFSPLVQFSFQLKSFLPSLTMWVIATERHYDGEKKSEKIDVNFNLAE